MKRKIIFLLIFFPILFISCSTCKTNEGESESEVTKNISDPKFLLKDKQKLAPGTAKILTTIDTLNIDNKNNTIVVFVEKVLGYGSATPTLNKTQKILIKMSDSQKESISSLNTNTKLVISSLQKSTDADDIEKWQLKFIDK